MNDWPGIWFAAWLNLAVYFPMILCLVALPFLLFPDGEVPSREWRWVWWLILGMSALAFVLTTIRPEFTDEISDEVVYRLDNPLGMEGVSAFFQSAAVSVVAGTLLALSLLAPAAAMIYRFRRSRGVERLQLKWLAYRRPSPESASPCSTQPQEFVSESSPWLDPVTTIALLGVLEIPVTAGIAIIRYRLYDIDRLISRTISYALLTGLLGGFYVLVVFLLGSLAFEGRIQVALSTLVVAALFNPLRHRLHNILDRRFFRSAYASQQVIADFTDLVRDEVDIDALVLDLIGVVDQTVAPRQMAVWVRQHHEPA